MKFLFVLFSLVFAVSCSKLESMSDTTEKMGKTTDEMKDSTKNIEKTSEELAVLTDDLYTGMREVESVMTQTEAFERLKAAPGMMEKTHYALIYFAAFEFQSWQDRSGDDAELRQRMYARGIELFFSQILDLVDDSFPIEQNNWDLLGGDNNWRILSVMAMTMAKIHPEQEARAREKSFEPQTFYSLLQSGLRAKRSYEAGEKIEEYQLAVLQNERTARYLLQLRHNFFKALVIGQLSNIEDGMMGGLFNKIGMSLPWSRWDVLMHTIPLAEIAKMNEWLWKAWETQAFLAEIGQPVQHNGAMDTVFSHAFFHVPQKTFNEVRSVKTASLSGQVWTLDAVKAQRADTFFFSLLKQVLPQGKEPPFTTLPSRH